MEKSEVTYTLIFSDGMKNVGKFVKLPKDFIQMIPYFDKMLAGGMIESNKTIFRAEHPAFTEELVKNYMQHLKWRFGYCTSFLTKNENITKKMEPDPTSTCDPYISVIAEYLNDIKFFVDFFAGGTIQIFKKEVILDGWGDKGIFENLLFNFEVPYGIYGTTNTEAIEILIGMIDYQIKKIIPESNIIFDRYRVFLIVPNEYVFKTTGSIKIFRQNQSGRLIIDLKMISRKYLVVTHNDFPKYLPTHVAETLSEQYIREIADGKGNGYRKLAMFVSKNITLAKIIWEGNEVTVCEMLRVPKSSHNKASKMNFDDIFKYADSVAKSREPEPGFDFSTDSTLYHLQKQIDQLYEKFNQIKHRYDHISSRCGLKTIGKIRDHFDSIDIDNPFIIRENIEKLEAQWWERYEILATSARKKQPLHRPISSIY